MTILYAIRRWFRETFRWRTLRFWWQRRTRGWDDSETWNLEARASEFMLPRLRRFRELNNGMPVGMTFERWNEVISEIEWFLEVHAGDDGVWAIDTDEKRARYESAGQLFGRYFGQLWW